MDFARRQIAFDAVDRATELPMVILSVVMVPLILAPLLLDISEGLEDAFLVADWAIWAIFGIELGVKTYLAPKRPAYLRQHWFDVLIVLLPFLRPLRIVRSARALRAVRLLRIVSFAARAVHSTRAILTQHGLQYVLLVGVLVIVGAAGLITLVEKDRGSIVNFGDGLWWAFVTVTTVGYGDEFPVTSEGRGIAVLLMLVGITLFGLVTANIAAFLVKPTAEDEPTLEGVMEHLRRLEAKIDALSERQPVSSARSDGQEQN